MFKIKKFFAFLGIILFLSTGLLRAEDNAITGAIDSVGADYIIVSGQKIMCDADFIKEAYFEQGDEVKIMVQKSDEGLTAVDYEYIYDEYDNSSDSNSESEDSAGQE